MNVKRALLIVMREDGVLNIFHIKPFVNSNSISEGDLLEGIAQELDFSVVPVKQ